jgi:hypothetical protein
VAPANLVDDHASGLVHFYRTNNYALWTLEDHDLFQGASRVRSHIGTAEISISTRRG